jgi:hypothetical protein
MDPYDVMQQSADDAGGHEGKRLKHNCKTGEVLLDGVAIGAAVRVVFFMDESTHGWLEFSPTQELIFNDIRRFAVVALDKNEQVPESYKPNTGCLAIIESTGQLATYQGAAWSVRSAFMTQLYKPYMRARKAAASAGAPAPLPVVSLSFKEEQRDDNGNYLPDFDIVDWVPRARYAMILGEVAPAADAALAAPATAAAPAQPLPKPKPMMIVTSGRQTAAPDTPTECAKPEATKAPDPAPANDEGYGDDYGGARGPIDDDIPF